METLRSLTPSESSLIHVGRGKYLPDSNLTVIQIMPSERANRRIDKPEPSDLEVITVMPQLQSKANSNMMKLHILNIRTGKIQDAIITSAEREFLKPKPFQKKSQGLFYRFNLKINIDNNLIGYLIFNSMTHNIINFAGITSRNVNSKKHKIVRIQPHADEPEMKFNEINISKKFPIKPYKLRNKFTSSKCKCEDTNLLWKCKKIQISIARCRSDQFMCCV